jgi:ParB-like chromosome segregation protein Spo0J
MNAPDHFPGPVSLGFERDCLVIPISAIVPLRPLRATVKKSHKYRQIAASIVAVGIIEPPVVIADRKNPGTYLLLDGHLRIEVLKDEGATEVECLISTDDEGYTYNKRISRLAAVQEHRMIVRAVDRGVPEEQIAAALAIDVVSVRRRFRLLDGICDETVDLLKDKPCPMASFEVLKRMTPLRQIEAAELMVGQNNYAVAFARAILIATPESELVDKGRAKSVKGISAEHIARMETELAALQAQVKSVEETFGIDTLHLTVAKGYVVRLLGNASVVRWLAQNRPEYLTEMQSIAEMTTTRPQNTAAE